MKWKDKSVFYKITTVVGVLCALAYLCIGACSLSGILPSVYQLPYAQFLFGMVWLCQGILNWKGHRVLAGFDFVIAVCSFFSALLG